MQSNNVKLYLCFYKFQFLVLTYLYTYIMFTDIFNLHPHANHPLASAIHKNSFNGFLLTVTYRQSMRVESTEKNLRPNDALKTKSQPEDGWKPTPIPNP